jgi:hypothetical protein
VEGAAPPPPPPPAPAIAALSAPATAPRPAATPRLEPLGPDHAPAFDDPSLASKAAPYAVVLVLLWILRRMFGSGDR